jgi:hypothetical protein
VAFGDFAAELQSSCRIAHAGTFANKKDQALGDGRMRENRVAQHRVGQSAQHCRLNGRHHEAVALLAPVKHRSAKAQADLTVIRARAGLVRARTALINTARGLTKSYGERLRGCNARNMNPEKAEGLSPKLQAALHRCWRKSNC